MHGHEAAGVTLQTHQGKFTREFRMLANYCGWNQQAQYDAFFNGLSEGIQDEPATQEPPAYFYEPVDLATHVDKRLKSQGHD